MSLGLRREVTCFTFDKGFNGMFYEWVKVSNVKRVSTGCKHGSCAFFDGLKSSLEIPRFKSAFRLGLVTEFLNIVFVPHVTVGVFSIMLFIANIERNSETCGVLSS